MTTSSFDPTYAPTSDAYEDYEIPSTLVEYQYEGKTHTRPRINWDKVHRFTPRLYRLYQTAPLWEIDSPIFAGPQDYHQYWAALIRTFAMQSKAAIGRWQQNGKQGAKALEQNNPSSSPIWDFQGALATEPLPLAMSMVHEKVALLASNPPKPQFTPQQESQNQQVAAINQLVDMVFAANDYRLKAAQGHYDIQFWNACCYRWNVHMDEPGLFGEPGEIELQKLDMQEIFPDPNCAYLHWKYMDYIIQKHVMEIGEIQVKYPMATSFVSAEVDEVISDTTVTSRNTEAYIQSPQPQLGRDHAARQQKITVLEGWVKDSRTRFMPLVDAGINPEYENRWKTDEDGYLIGKWVKRYPAGRSVVVTGTAVLKDMANPFPHGQFPYVFATGMPATTPFSCGNAMRLMIVSRKINNIIGEIHQYFQSEIQRPMTSTPGAINDPNLAQKIPNQSNVNLELSGPAARFERRQAMDVPPSVYTYIQILQGFLDTVSGSAAIMRGQLAEGDQLSAEAVGALQQYASSRLALEAGFFEAAVKQLGYQLMWILRRVVQGTITVTVKIPATGEVLKIDWKSDRDVFESNNPIAIQQLRAKEDYLIGIKAGTGSPGAEGQKMASAVNLFDKKLIDRQAALDAMEYPDRDAIVQRFKGAENEDAFNAAFAKEMGVNFKEAMKRNQPGRKEKP